VDDSLHVLHFQLEGSEEEALNSYSGGLISKNAFYYERGKISDFEMKCFEEQVKKCPYGNKNCFILHFAGDVPDKRLHFLWAYVFATRA
jgi:hypothetical protein